MANYQTLLVVVVVLAFFVYLYWELDKRAANISALMQVKRTEDELNDDDSAVNNVLPLIEQAERLLEIYDDGDDFPESMYNNRDFVSSVEKRLAENEEFRVQCLFNEDEDLFFIRRLVSHSRVDVYVRVRGEEDEVHYKIMDGGVKAYVSVHDPDDKRQRTFKETDCSDVPKKKLHYVTESIFADIRQDLQNFKKKELVT